MNKKLKRMTGIALLMALVVVMQQVTMVIPPISGFSISLVLLPIVLGAALYGPSAGALLGGAFGAIVFFNCVTGADAGGAMVFQANPILCLLVVMAKGILCGLGSGLVYHGLKQRYSAIAITVSAAICPVINTGIFVVCMLTFFKDVLSAWAGGGNILAYILTGLVLCNFLPELIINVVFSPAAGRIIHMLEKQ